jgi:hypothetical protein
MTPETMIAKRGESRQGLGVTVLLEIPMATILTQTDAYTLDAVNGLHVTAADALAATGWTLKPEGMCRDHLCVPMPTIDGRIDLAAFWQKLGNPVVSDGDVWSLGAGPEAHRASLAGLDAPDFELQDLAGQTHRLSSLRGKKVFLSSWASW